MGIIRHRAVALAASVLASLAASVLASPGPGDDVRSRMLAEINRIRASKGVGPLAIDDRLTRPAQDHADALARRAARPHDGFPGRLYSAGFPRMECRIRYGAGNVSEGVSWGGDDPVTAVAILDSSPDPEDGHRRDFEDPAFNRVGLGYAGLWWVVDYGALCPGAPTVVRRVDGSAPTPEQSAALEVVNQGRARIGRPPLAFDARLTRAAQAQSDRIERWRDIPRHSTLEEIYSFGFPQGPPPRDARRNWRHNVAEGCLGNTNGGLVSDTRQYVEESVRGQRTDPDEPHNYDFAIAQWNRVGFASNGWGFTIIYGLAP